MILSLLVVPDEFRHKIGTLTWFIFFVGQMSIRRYQNLHECSATGAEKFRLCDRLRLRGRKIFRHRLRLACEVLLCKGQDVIGEQQQYPARGLQHSRKHRNGLTGRPEIQEIRQGSKSKRPKGTANKLER